MKIIGRYIFKEFMRIFIAAVVGILSVYLCVDFLQKADDFIRLKADISKVAKYFLYSLPAIATPSIPIAALVATLLSLGNLSRHNEIIAMRAGGYSLGRIIAPVLTAGILASALGFINNEMIMPTYAAKALYIRKVEVEKKERVIVFRRQKLWLRGPDNSIANIELVSPDKIEMFGVNIYKLNPDFTVRGHIIAGRLVWEDGAWRLKDSRKFVPSGKGISWRRADGEKYNVVDSPDSLNMVVRSSEEMTFAELMDYIARLKKSGYNIARYEVELYGKMAFPLSSLMMVMIATPLSLQRVRSGGTGRGIAISVLIAFAYWALMSIGSALGRSAALPPLPAAWLANIVFAAASGYILIRMHREG